MIFTFFRFFKKRNPNLPQSENQFVADLFPIKQGSLPT